MPLGIILIIYLIGRNQRNPWHKKSYYNIAIWLAILFTNPILGNEIMSLWEYKPIAINDLPQNYDIGIVLTGISDNSKQPRDRIYYQKGADRVLHTYRLYKMGKIKKILISGGSGSFGEVEVKEADNLKKAFEFFGVPSSDIIIENESVNTRQSAVNCKEILSGESYNSALLITSAFHLRRASKCFAKVGIEHDIFPTDFYSSTRKFTPDRWIPSPGALKNWTIVFHEVVGIAAYWVMGYVSLFN